MHEYIIDNSVIHQILKYLKCQPINDSSSYLNSGCTSPGTVKEFGNYKVFISVILYFRLCATYGPLKVNHPPDKQYFRK